MESRSALVGRDMERRLLHDALAGAADGRPAALLVSGEAGVGKTRLVSDVGADLGAEGFQVLWGRCVRFGATSSSFVPFSQLVTGWFVHADEVERARILAGAQELGTIAPTLGLPAATGDPQRLLPLLSTVLERIAAATPTVLVIDDLQWCDASSLDVLSFLITGFTESRQIALVGIHRDIDASEGHPLHRWLADMRRMPRVSALRLGRLDLHDTELQVATLTVSQQSPRLAEEVFARSGGNPCLTELLVTQDAGSTSPDVGSPVSDALQEVLLAAWHQLTAPTRELMQLLAVGGRPVTFAVLERVADARGLGADKVVPGIAEAAAEGVAATQESGEAWFRHPLVAEALLGKLPSSEAWRIHQAYVDVLQDLTDLPSGMRAAHLALHHEGAGRADDAFTWSLRAADAAAMQHGYAEEAQHLQRAVRLSTVLSPAARDAAPDMTGLLLRASQSAHRAGELDSALAMVEQALQRVDPKAFPNQASQLLLDRSLLRMLTGVDANRSVEEHRHAVSLSSAHPDSAEHALALAWLAYAEVWNERTDAAIEDAEKAVVTATNCSANAALALALAVRAHIRAPHAGALADAVEALGLARASGDSHVLSQVGICYSNVLYDYGRQAEAAPALESAFRQLRAAGAAQQGARVGAAAAMQLMALGHLRESRALLREVLSIRSAPMVSAKARLFAAQLEVRTGNLTAARQHQRRAAELTDITAPGSGEPAAVIEIAIAGGEYASALDLIADLMPHVSIIDPDFADSLLVYGAQATAGWRQRDGGEQTFSQSAAARRLAELERLRGTEPTPFLPRDARDTVHPAIGALYAAERARALNLPDQAAAWRKAVQACEVAGLCWDGAVASFRLGETLLNRREGRTEAAAALRCAHAAALDLGAADLQTDVESLCTQARISLVPPVTSDGVPPPARLAALTAREREVLAHLVAGRTYAEIAHTLMISEKTVSVHVSNLLRKTGTSSRIEVAALARNLQAQ